MTVGSSMLAITRSLPPQPRQVSISIAAVHLHRNVTRALERARVGNATPRELQNTAVAIHLCGAAAGAAYVRQGFRLAGRRVCGDHDVEAYLAKVNAMKRVFARLSSAPGGAGGDASGRRNPAPATVSCVSVRSGPGSGHALS